ncbi:cytochrome c oxidase assembly protein [Paracoccus siganidrum]|uniref:Cytochrome c oxidase assembly protein n=1 Tax=Paracoccus siganidrum TaxID=1276757 RepID=A0A418ZVA5_9RHOB|nr:cytochrome c oxidase assembly protein [Paracoccus siganidrum]RJL03421.1 cytochrome c oxidase assembly protein [Paracoccus siganidrum]RMC35865.1 cytochrome c oxidase assembly protein [Paracoccus siganidrum]
MTTQPYCGPGAAPDQLWSSWNGDPVLLAGLALAGGALLHARRGPASTLALAALVVAFVSPLCALTVSLFSARAAHHLLLAGVAAPALALALPIARRLPASLSAAALALAMLGWHLPGLYDAAWRHDAVYWAMQAALLLPAWAFWSAVLTRPADAAATLGHALLVAALAGVMGLLGAVLTFAPQPLYLQHLGGAADWGIGALDDQRLAGLILWVPGFLPMAALGLALLRRGWQRGLAA